MAAKSASYFLLHFRLFAFELDLNTIADGMGWDGMGCRSFWRQFGVNVCSFSPWIFIP
jgi:hypothetical protein